jgi:rRNA-processing protein FCF1
MPKAELEDLSTRWGRTHGHDVVVVWEGPESADNQIAREVFALEPPIWVVTSDRELRERVRDRAERIIGGGAFARELREG